MSQRCEDRRNVFIIYFIFLKHLINNHFQLKKVNDNNNNNMS